MFKAIKIIVCTDMGKGNARKCHGTGKSLCSHNVLSGRLSGSFSFSTGRTYEKAKLVEDVGLLLVDFEGDKGT